MRVISGEFRRAKLLGPPEGQRSFRPTGDRVRENAFNLLQPLLDGAEFLDLFAGTGAAGIEAVSRGARRATFVENSPVSLKVLRANVEKILPRERVKIAAVDAVKFTSAAGTGAKFDVVYADPPYATGQLEAVLENLGAGGMLNPGAVVVGESNRPPETDRHGALELSDKRKYGKTWVVVWKFTGPAEETDK